MPGPLTGYLCLDGGPAEGPAAREVVLDVHEHDFLAWEQAKVLLQQDGGQVQAHEQVNLIDESPVQSRVEQGYLAQVDAR